MAEATSILSGRGEEFPRTRWTMIRDATDPRSPTYRDSLEILAGSYWRPVYAYFRRKWGKTNEEAKDLTQDFFADLTEREFLGNISGCRGRFRSYVKACLDNFVRLEHRYRSAQKRGGGVARVALEIGEGFEPSDRASPDDVFLQEWIGAILDGALQELEREYAGRDQSGTFALFVRKEVHPPEGEDLSYEGLARHFGVSVTEVRNRLYVARRRLRELVIRRIQESVTSPEEAQQEMEELFGGLLR